MADVKKNLAYTAIPLAALAVAGLIMKKVAGRTETAAITEEVKEAADHATKDFQNAFTDLRYTVEGRTGRQIEKNIDTAVANAKSRLDRIASQLKDRLNEKNRRAA